MGVTNLPIQVALRVYEAGGILINIDINENPFSHFAVDQGGYFLQQPSGVALPELVEALV